MRIPMRRAYDIVAYTYKAQNLCPDCTVKALRDQGRVTPAALRMRAEDVLDQLAAYDLVDRHDEYTFDSDDFPKVVFLCQTEDGEQCTECQEEL